MFRRHNGQLRNEGGKKEHLGGKIVRGRKERRNEENQIQGDKMEEPGKEMEE